MSSGLFREMEGVDVSIAFRLILVLLLASSCHRPEPPGQRPAEPLPVRPIAVDAAVPVGTIRSFQGVNGGPAPLMPGLADVRRQYRDIGIDMVRVHDFFGPADIDARWPDPDRIARTIKASG